MEKIPYNKPFIAGNELAYISDAVSRGQLSGDGDYTEKCHACLENKLGIKKILLTHSCTAALEMAAILCNIQPGDEVIMPSYTFVSTANAFVLRGAKPVFVDIRQDTLNIDEKLIEQAITSKTKVIVPVHYAGVACEMDTIMNIAKKHNLMVVEDAAQGVDAYYKGRALGSIGDLGCFSFHETKNYISGEGGALAVNNPEFARQSEIIREKGTNRAEFFRGEVDKYTWQNIGSSYLPSELIAAFLYAQLECAENITRKRLQIWNRYNEELQPLEQSGDIVLPHIPDNCKHNGHLFYCILKSLEVRECFLAFLKEKGILAIFHYVPLHLSPMAKKLHLESDLPVTSDLAERIVRLPIYFMLDEEQHKYIIATVKEFFGK
jgi:dTDP-4-amino-4,6-dideoxygalactose transaminase